jgi:hypothetical protein
VEANTPRQEGELGPLGALLAKAWAFLERRRTLVTSIVTLSAALVMGAYCYLIDRYRIPVPFKTSDSFYPDYCYEIAWRAEALANVHFVGAVFLTAVVVVAGYMAVSHGNTMEAPYRGTVAAIVVLLSVPAAFMMYRRSDAAVELAAVANEARSPEQPLAAGASSTLSADPPARAYNVCSKAWSAWVRSRMESNAIGRAALQESAKMTPAPAATASAPATPVPAPAASGK